MQLLTGYAKPIIALAITPDGKTLYSAAEGHSMVWEWDLETHQIKRKLRTEDNRYGFSALALVPIGRRLLASQIYGRLLDVDLDTGESRGVSVYQGATGGGTPTPAVHPGGRFLAVPFHRSWQSAHSGYAIFDLETSKRVAEKEGHNSQINHLAFSADGSQLATASNDGRVRLWSYPGNEPRHAFRHEVAPKLVAFRPDGKVIASSGGHSVFTWDTSTGERIGKLAGHKGIINSVAYSPDGRYLASVANDGVIFLRDAQTNEVVGRRHLELGKLKSMVWLPDSSGVVVGGAKLIALCSLEELLVKQEIKRQPRGEPLSIAGHLRKVETLAYSRDGRFLASASKGQVRIHDLTAGPSQAKERVAFSTHAYEPPRGMLWSPDGNLLALSYSGSRYGQPNQIRVCDTTTGQVAREVGPPQGNPRHVFFTPSGQLLVIGSDETQQRHTRFEVSNPDGSDRLWSADIDYPARHCPLWPRVFGAQEERLYLAVAANVLLCPRNGDSKTIIHHKCRISGFAVRSDERLAVTLGGKSAYVWRLPEGEQELELKHLLQVSGAAFIPGERLLTACYDGIVRLWDLTGGTELHAWDLGMGKIYCLDVSPDHMTFAAGVEKKSRIVLMDVPD
jgi:WD40 repeat protein